MNWLTTSREKSAVMVVILSSGWFKPDPEFWKKISYSTQWKRHWEKVEALLEKLIRRFPDLENSMKFGLGSITNKWLKIPPDEKGEPDIYVYHEYKLICSIEVSGSDKVNMPGDIWIRPDKVASAGARGGETWYYMVYPNEVRALTRETAERCVSNVVYPHIKKDLDGRPVRERYIAVPYRESSPEEVMFQWIQAQVRRLRTG